MKRQLQLLANCCKGHANNVAAEAGETNKDDMVLLEEIEDFVLEDIGKLLMAFDSNHPLLVAVSSVRELGLQPWGESEG
jgi:importin-5